MADHDIQLLNRVFQEAQMNYTKVREVYDNSDYEKGYPLGGHWINNMKELIELISSEADPVKKIAKIHETVMYSINTSDEVIKTKMIEWYDQYFTESGVNFDTLDPSICESDYSSEINRVDYKGRIVSPDFLRTVIICLELQKHCQFPKERFKVMELGAGYGGLARTIRLFNPNITTVITDIPETLYFSFCFLRLNYPTSKFCYVNSEDSIKEPLENYDFVFVPTIFSELLEGNQFELFYNTASMGEMRNEVIRYWVDYIQNKIDVKYFFGLNRYLNNIYLEYEEYRKMENECSVLFDSHWDVVQWEVDPEFARCPYYETLVSRNLELIIQRQPKNNRPTDEDNQAKSQGIVDSIADQDWFTHPTVKNYRIEKGSSYWPLTSTRGFNVLTPDLTKEGTLFSLWEAIRLYPTKENVLMMLKYLDVIEGKHPFEERFYYEELLKSLGGEVPLKEEDKKQPSAMRTAISKTLPQPMKELIKKVLKT